MSSINISSLITLSTNSSTTLLLSPFNLLVSNSFKTSLAVSNLSLLNSVLFPLNLVTKSFNSLVYCSYCPSASFPSIFNSSKFLSNRNISLRNFLTVSISSVDSDLSSFLSLSFISVLKSPREPWVGIDFSDLATNSDIDLFNSSIFLGSTNATLLLFNSSNLTTNSPRTALSLIL